MLAVHSVSTGMTRQIVHQTTGSQAQPLEVRADSKVSMSEMQPSKRRWDAV